MTTCVGAECGELATGVRSDDAAEDPTMEEPPAERQVEPDRGSPETEEFKSQAIDR